MSRAIFRLQWSLMTLLSGCATAPSQHNINPQNAGAKPPSPAPLAPSQPTAPSQAKPQAASSGQSGQGSSVDPIGQNTATIARLSAIETAFLLDDCATVLAEAAKLDLSKLQSKSASALPPLTNLSLSICESARAPADKDKAHEAIAAIDKSVNDYRQGIDKAWLMRLRSARAAAIGDRDAMLESKRRERIFLTDMSSRGTMLDQEIFETSDASGPLNNEQRAALREIMTVSASPDKAVQALIDLDRLIERTPEANLRKPLLQQRHVILARIENSFAFEASQLYEEKMTGRDGEAKTRAQTLQAHYPHPLYEQRIAAIIGGTTLHAACPAAASSSANAASSTSGTTGGASISNSSSAVPLPSASPSPGEPTTGTPTEPISAERMLADARAKLDGGDPAGAVALLDSVPEPERNDKVRRLRREAAEQHIKDLRTQVREIYNRASAQSNKATKIEGLKQCKQILELIMSRYPDASARPGVERNLRTINNEIEFLAKGP